MFRFEKNVSTAPLSNSNGFWLCCNETRCLIKLCHKHSGAKTSVPVFSCEVVTGPQALDSSHQTCASKLQSQQLETLQSERWFSDIIAVGFQGFAPSIGYLKTAELPLILVATRLLYRKNVTSFWRYPLICIFTCACMHAVICIYIYVKINVYIYIICLYIYIDIKCRYFQTILVALCSREAHGG